MSSGFIPAHGGYQDLLSYQKSVIVYDVTVRFCDRFLSKFDRTVDQMVQAARSGKQNIIEGSMASGTSKETEIKLTNVARASLEELLNDHRIDHSGSNGSTVSDGTLVEWRSIWMLACWPVAGSLASTCINPSRS